MVTNIYVPARVANYLSWEALPWELKPKGPQVHGG